MSNVFVKNPNPPIGLTPSENMCFAAAFRAEKVIANTEAELDVRGKAQMSV